MPGPIFEAGERITLRTAEDEDAEFLATHSNDPRIRDPMTLVGPTNLDEQREHIGDDGDGAQFLVCVEGDDAGYDERFVTDDGVEPIGFVMFFHVNERAGNGEVAYWLSPAVHGEGYSTEAVSLVLDYAFESRRLHRMEARALSTNEASRGLLESLGFREEGVSRDAKFVRGEHVDVHDYGLLEEEWLDGDD
ncbi:GNAT family N-acetyltransferase [Haloarchaeobius litoreus]|uniref:GNAT family N-acetyltransferase n=1 Tax=Haloarchaeobius litoreus TaxID=755306 RepID=A0ABD6DNT6_9EURY|nr:GNAT family protein [Haloarchaeobius litoreus]